MRPCIINRYQSPAARFRQFMWDKLEEFGVDLFGQTCFLFGLTTIAGFGVYVAIPTLYGEASDVGWALTWFGYVCAVEIFVNWVCIKIVDSTYIPTKHGTQPENVSIGKDYRQIMNRGFYDNDVDGKRENESILRKDVTAVPVNYDNVQEGRKEDSTRTVYPYFSWKPCLRCKRHRPPRAYHCPICNICILKRDHHCFVTGVCIGHNNLRHFAVMLFWSTLATTFAGLHSLAYFYYEILPYCSILDLFLPIAMLRCLVFRVTIKHMVLICIGWLLCGFFVWSLLFGRRIWIAVTTGLTSWEQWEREQLHDSRPMDQKLKAVFGKMWWINFILPVHFVFKPVEDPVNWPSFKTL